MRMVAAPAPSRRPAHRCAATRRSRERPQVIAEQSDGKEVADETMRAVAIVENLVADQTAKIAA